MNNAKNSYIFLSLLLCYQSSSFAVTQSTQSGNWWNYFTTCTTQIIKNVSSYASKAAETASKAVEDAYGWMCIAAHKAGQFALVGLEVYALNEYIKEKNLVNRSEDLYNSFQSLRDRGNDIYEAIQNSGTASFDTLVAYGELQKVYNLAKPKVDDFWTIFTEVYSQVTEIKTSLEKAIGKSLTPVQTQPVLQKQSYWDKIKSCVRKPIDAWNWLCNYGGKAKNYYDLGIKVKDFTDYLQKSNFAALSTNIYKKVDSLKINGAEIQKQYQLYQQGADIILVGGIMTASLIQAKKDYDIISKDVTALSLIFNEIYAKATEIKKAYELIKS